ncbi:hypothetical protein ISO77_04680, partial [Morganella morganii subsp. morganii]|nr:hypothetical protein [Morganella morganii subsp. morganii]
MKEHISAKDKRSLRVADKDIPALPSTSVRRNKQLGFDNNGMPLLLDPAETGALGYVLVDSFEKGEVITSRYQALHWLHNGEYYRWDGALPKAVPANSTPDSSGGIGVGAWIGVGDTSLRKDLASAKGSSMIGGMSVISALSHGVASGIDCLKLIQRLQDESEEKRIPIDFSGISEICFSGHISVGDFFHWKGAGKFDTTIKPLSLTIDDVGTNGHGVHAWFQRKDPSVNIDFAMLEDIGIDGQYVGDHETPMNR